MSVPTDEHLMARIMRADQEALRVLMDRHMARSLRVAERIVGSNMEADDICQEAFLRVWQKAGFFDPKRGSFKTWLYRLVVNLAIDRTRSKGKRHATLEAARDVPAPGSDSEAMLMEAQRRREFSKALEQLAANQRAAIVLFHGDELSGREAAQVLGLSEKAFESLLNRARANLRKRFQPPKTGG